MCVCVCGCVGGWVDWVSGRGGGEGDGEERLLWGFGGVF